MGPEPTRLKQLADSLITAFTRLDESEQHIAVRLYRLLAEGKPVVIARLAAELGTPTSTVSDALDQWPGVFRVHAGRVIGFWGLAIPEMPHRFIVDGRRLHTWCAWDSLFIPEILGKTAQVESTCPATKRVIRLAVGPRGVAEMDPETTVVSFLKPQVAFDENVILNFCHYVHFFVSAEAAVSWVAAHPQTFLLSMQEAFELGRLTNAAHFGAALRHAEVGRR
ncbi:MAG: alkylmercury lyase MerB [bacterium]